MPRGGPRPGTGPKPGQPFKKTVQRRIEAGVDDKMREMEASAKRALATADSSRSSPAQKKQAVDVLEDHMHFMAGLTAQYAPRPAGVPENPNFDEKRFRYYAGRTMRWANSLAKYQSPTFRAVAFMGPAGVPTDQPAPLVIDGDNVVRIGDFTSSMRIYENLMKVGKRTSGGRG